MDDLYDDNGQFDDDVAGDLFGDEEIQQNDAWDVINKYFHTKGLVGQQLDSFNEFVQSTISDTIDDNGEVTVTSENQYRDLNNVDVSLPQDPLSARSTPIHVFPTRYNAPSGSAVCISLLLSFMRLTANLVSFILTRHVYARSPMRRPSS